MRRNVENKVLGAGYLYNKRNTKGTSLKDFFKKKSYNERNGKFDEKTKKRLSRRNFYGKSRTSVEKKEENDGNSLSIKGNNNPRLTNSKFDDICKKKFDNLAGIKRRRTGDYGRFGNGKMKVFSKSYDHKINKKTDLNSLKQINKRERVSGIGSIDKTNGDNCDINVKSTHFFQPLKGRKSSSRAKKANKIFLSHRDFLKKTNSTDNNVQNSTKGYFSQTKKDKSLRVSREKEAPALPGLGSYVTQVPENNLVGIDTKEEGTESSKESRRGRKRRSINVRKESRKNFRVTSKSRNDSPVLKKKSRKFERFESLKVNTGDVDYYVKDMIKYYNTKKKTYFSNIFKDHFKHSFISMQFCKNMKPPKKSEVHSRKVKIIRKTQNLGKKTLILDLDETLIHCNTNSNAKTDLSLPVKFPTGEKIQAPINVRPHAKEFLQQMAEVFEVVIFTASHSCYANVVIDHLDPENKYVSHRLFRESCIQSDAGVFIKDLRIIEGRSMKEMVLVDNASYSFAYQINNGIPIVPFYDSKNDDQLLKLAKYLLEMNKCDDVRLFNKSYFKFEKLMKASTQHSAYLMMTEN